MHQEISGLCVITDTTTQKRYTHLQLAESAKTHGQGAHGYCQCEELFCREMFIAQLDEACAAAHGKFSKLQVRVALLRRGVCNDAQS